MKFEIMLKILFELLSKKCVSAKYIAEKYGVCVRSVYRYIESLELAGVPLYTIRGNGGGIAIIDTYKLSSTFMTEKEFQEVITTLSAVTNSVPNSTLNSAILKLEASIKKEFHEINFKSGNLIIDGSSWGDSNHYKTKLKVINDCIENNLKLDIVYHDRNGEITKRIIHPYIIMFKQGIWYVYAYCEMRKEFRFFKTGRIEKANTLNEKFERTEINESDLNLDFWDNASETDEVVLEIDKSCLSDVEEWLGINNVESIDNKHVARVKLPVDSGLISKIMSFGKGLKVIAPKKLVESIKSTALDIVSNYEK